MSNWSILDIIWLAFGLALSCIAIWLCIISFLEEEKPRFWYKYITKRSNGRTKNKEYGGDSHK